MAAGGRTKTMTARGLFVLSGISRGAPAGAAADIFLYATFDWPARICYFVVKVLPETAGPGPCSQSVRRSG